MSTITVLFKGIAIGYVKDVPLGTSSQTFISKHHVLFPFNECHSLRFSHQNASVAQSPNIFVGHLGSAGAQIKLSVSNPSIAASFGPDFLKTVLDMTSNEASKETHDSLTAKSNWNQNGVIMALDNAKMMISKTFNDKEHIPHLYDGINSTQIDIENTPLLYEAKAIINLKTDEFLTVTRGTEVLFTSTANNNYILTFDNDCMDDPATNDMDMIYEILTDQADSSKKFYIQCYHGPSTHKSSDTGLHDGKPCLFVHVSKADDLPVIS